MDSPTTIRSAGKPPEVLSPCGSRRRRNSYDSSSPEFEFWRVPNPSSIPDPDLVSADELFFDGVLLPLHLLSSKPTHPPADPDSSKPDPDPRPLIEPADPPAPLIPKPEPEPISEKPGPGPELTRESAVTGMTASKRWKDIFRKSENKPPAKSREEREKEKESKKKEKKSVTVSGSGSGSGSAELNINIWPFSRSRSAGNSVSRPRMSFGGAPANRKVSSAPCSRSNSAGESKSSRKWPSSPGRPGVHLGRSSPVWQVRRGAGGGPNGKLNTEPAVRSSERSGPGMGKREITEGRRGKTVNENNMNKAKVLNLNVPMCIGYRSRLSCRSYESGNSNSRSGDSNFGSGTSHNVGNGTATSTTTATITNNNNNLFGLRHLFTKKVH